MRTIACLAALFVVCGIMALAKKIGTIAQPESRLSKFAMRCAYGAGFARY